MSCIGPANASVCASPLDITQQDIHAGLQIQNSQSMSIPHWLPTTSTCAQLYTCVVLQLLIN